MKKTIITSIAFLFCISLFAQGIKFEKGTFPEALAKAKAENKMVFMDCHTVWCGPCKKLSSDIFPQKAVGDFFNKNFVSIKMDMEKGEGIELNKKYAVRAYPTLLFIDSDGKLVYSKMGFMQADALINEAKNAIEKNKK